jgi:hypothetical protein
LKKLGTLGTPKKRTLVKYRENVAAWYRENIPKYREKCECDSLVKNLTKKAVAGADVG